MIDYLYLAHFLGVLFGLFILVYAINEDNLGGLLIDVGIKGPMTNGVAIIIALLLISVWPVLILKPLYNWLKEPCIHD